MNEKVNTPAKWLKYLLYVGIAAVLNSLGVYSLLGPLARWVVLAINAASVYLLFRLREMNPRYQKAAVFSAISLVGSLISNTFLTMAFLVCDLIAQYQEYHAHGELVEDRDARLAGKWNSLFWLQFVLSLVLSLVVTLFGVALVMIAETLTTTVTSILSVILSLIVQVLYLVYLHRTVKLLENEIVV